MSDFKCYYHPENDQIPYGANVCNDTTTETGFYPCCAVGDICIPNNLCHFTHFQTGTSGYYSAACTDPLHQDPACSQVCVDQPVPDVVYNATTSLWACCGVGNDGSVSCADPTAQTFGAPAPQILLQSTVALLTAVPTRALTTSSTAPTASAQPTNQAIRAPGQSTKIAAIGLGAVLGVVILVLLGAGAWLFRKRRRDQTRSIKTAQHNPTCGIAETHGAMINEAWGSVSYPEKKFRHDQGGFDNYSGLRYNGGYEKPLPNPHAHEVSAWASPRPHELGVGEPF